MKRSPTYSEGTFHNLLPTPMPMPKMGPMLRGWLRGKEIRRPREPVPIAARHKADLAGQARDLRVTWLGHSTLLVELDGRRLLTDPVWAKRIGPVPLVGPTRFHPPPLALVDLPPLDAVVISHDHYDHLDASTVRRLNKSQRDVPFIVPLGVGAHLERWGVPSRRIRELGWWQEVTVAGLRLVALPARHFSGRGVGDRNATLWASFALIGPRHRVFFSGDTGMHRQFGRIGEQLGPFDLTALEMGAYNQLWADLHIGPEQAVAAHRLLRGKVLLPIHWGTFNLSFHAWTEPAERLLVASARAGVSAVVPRPGESIDPRQPPRAARWWPEIPWQRAEQAPVISSNVDVASLGPAGPSPSPSFGNAAQ